MTTTERRTQFRTDYQRVALRCCMKNIREQHDHAMCTKDFASAEHYSRGILTGLFHAGVLDVIQYHLLCDWVRNWKYA